MIKSERYGGGLRWYCTKCDVNDYIISWTNSYPPPYCIRCTEAQVNINDAAITAIKWLKNKYQERAVFPGSIRAIANLCELHGLVPTGTTKTKFAKIINEVAKDTIF